MVQISQSPGSFIDEIIEADNASERFASRVHTRFPPEPNGYLHIGHAKAMSLDFGLALKYGGKCNLRFDDTNPTREEQEFVDGIIEDIHWLGYDWEDRLFFASDYFDQLYDWAVKLINDGKAYVDDLSPDEMRTYRGTLTEPGKDSPFRTRSVEENLDLLHRMKQGEFPDGARVLRAKIDMASPNINMRDPVMYRIRHAEHHRTGNTWCIYPTYDWAHGQSDSIERVTHSICTLEYADHRPLYDWFLEQLDIYQPRQIEFARVSTTYTIVSKRKLRKLVEEGHVRGWDDPRMPTLRAMKRRGYTPAAIRDFCERVGVAKTKSPNRSDSTVEIELLEHCVRQDLNLHVQRAMGVLRPLKVVITNYPENQVQMITAVNNPEDETMGTRQVPFSRVLYIEQDDFMENPPKDFFRLAPGREVRLRYTYFIRCEEVIKDEQGNIVELRCTCDPATADGNSPDGRKVKATLHWVSAAHALDAEVRVYEHLFVKPYPEDTDNEEDFVANLNPNSLQVLQGCKIEPAVKGAAINNRYQFERLGYFCVDADSTGDSLVFNRTLALKDTWAKVQKRNA